MKTRVIVQKEVKVKVPQFNNDSLCLQKVVYQYPDGQRDAGFRFIYRDAQDRMKAQRGQANLLSLDLVAELLEQAKQSL